MVEAFSYGISIFTLVYLDQGPILDGFLEYLIRKWLSIQKESPDFKPDIYRCTEIHAQN